MKAVGVIAEYNPFHNGHLYHLNKVKEMYPNHVIIVILGGNFLQRGETSIINKWDKTSIALAYGVDIVVELPFPFATQSADIFAKGSVELLKNLKVEYLVFGSESNDVDNLIKLAKIQLDDKRYDTLVHQYLKEGLNYPTALSKSLHNISDVKINTPNDILGICYIKEILKQKANIIPITIKRTNDYHSFDLKDDIVSASSIRKAIKDKKKIKKFVPKVTYNYLKKDLHFTDDYYQLLKYKILSDIDNLNDYQTVDEGIENRIKKNIVVSANLTELVDNIKTKRYTRNRIQRMLVHILTSFSKEDAKNNKDINYIRILGFSDQGRQYLNKIKRNLTLPIITKYSPVLNLELRATSIYASILEEDAKREMIEKEYKNNVIKKES